MVDGGKGVDAARLQHPPALPWQIRNRKGCGTASTSLRSHSRSHLLPPSPLARVDGGTEVSFIEKDEEARRKMWNKHAVSHHSPSWPQCRHTLPSARILEVASFDSRERQPWDQTLAMAATKSGQRVMCLFHAFFLWEYHTPFPGASHSYKNKFTHNTTKRVPNCSTTKGRPPIIQVRPWVEFPALRTSLTYLWRHVR